MRTIRGLDVLCKANMICDNTDAIELDNGLFKSIPIIEKLTARLNKTALREGRRLGFELEKINFTEDSLGPESVRYLLIEHKTDGLDEALDGIRRNLKQLNVESPDIKFHAFYHPTVIVHALDGEEASFIPQGRAFTRGSDSIIEFNIALPPEVLVDHVAREMTYFAMSERAICTPSLRVVNDYHLSLFENSHRRNLSKTVTALEKRLSGLEGVFEELSSRLEDRGADFLEKLETFVRRVESVPRRLIGD